MNHVAQTHRSGCGIACAAMIKGQSYEEVLRWWSVIHNGKPERLNTIGDGLRKFELCDLLASMQCEAPVVEAPAILIIQRGNFRHYVVVTKDGKILDPLEDPQSGITP